MRFSELLRGRPIHELTDEEIRELVERLKRLREEGLERRRKKGAAGAGRRRKKVQVDAAE